MIHTHPFSFGGILLDIIVDTEIMDIRQRAKEGNFYSMVSLAAYMIRGIQTPKNVPRAKEILEQVLAHKDQLESELYWDTLCLLGYTTDDDYSVNQMAVTVIRDIVQAHPSDWDFGKLFSGLRRIERALDDDPDSFG